MSYKELAFATAAVLAALPALTAANAGPAFNGLALQRNDASAVKIDYYYPGYYYGEPPYYGRGLADVPGDVIDGALGVVGGAIGGALNGSDYYARPYPTYGPSYYGGPYYGAYEESPVAACQRDFPSFVPETGTFFTDSGEEFICPYLER